MNTELLREALTHIPEDSDLARRVAEFLSSPVHVGDTLSFRAEWPGRGDKDAYGTRERTSRHRKFNFDTREYEEGYRDNTWTEPTFPEYAPVRSSSFEDLGRGIVVEINGHNYRINAIVQTGDISPDLAHVTFTATDDPETPWTPFDEDAARQEAIERLRENIAEYEEMVAESERDGDSDRSWMTGTIEEDRCRIWNLEHGEDVWAPGDVVVFGQPRFIQNPIFPTHEGRPAMHLMTLETGWGDSGNVNILFACDDNGVPCAAWMEASCC
jgi:hypothetical protein